MLHWSSSLTALQTGPAPPSWSDLTQESGIITNLLSSNSLHDQWKMLYNDKKLSSFREVKICISQIQERRQIHIFSFLF